MTVHVVFQFTVIDRAKLLEYIAHALPTVAQHGGHEVGAGEIAILHESHDYDRGAIFAFPDRPTALGWYESPEYRLLFGLRSSAMNCSVVLIGQ